MFFNLYLMRYSCYTEINLPLARVVELFDNAANLKEWMPGLMGYEHLSGIPGMPGAKAKLRFQMGRRMMEMTETITVRNLPQEFSGRYEANGVTSEVRNLFEAIDEGRTRYSTDTCFQFKGVMKLAGWLMPGVFRKTSQDYLDRFRRFAEAQG